MAAQPASLTLRMFNVGFGDCFLLTFNYANSVRHMLVDFGSTSAPKRGAKKDYMLRVAEKIKEICAGKLHIVVATHRHRDHISGFSTAAKTGKLIAQLNPDIVIQPWTEDPRAQTHALTAKSTLYTRGKADPRKMTDHFLGALEDMHGVAAAVKRMAAHESLAGKQTRAQLQFLGDDNLKNESAVRNLIRMGRKGQAYFVNAGMKLDILPGVACTVLGPPTLKQSDEIRAMRASDPGEFWQFRTFWASQNLARRPGAARPLIPIGTPATEPPAGVRWFIDQSRQIQADQMLGLVRDLDDVMNNTSVILLLEVGKQKILLPGDAQIENWSYALSKPEWCKRLADVNLYKVGHHGSRNATPKRLWHLFKHAGPAQQADRIATLCSTKSGKHGSTRSGTEVPRHLLVKELKENSQFTSSEEAQDSFCNEVTIHF
jgi:beta-lactamase superfamily II metal-dependent hydrolase